MERNQIRSPGANMLFFRICLSGIVILEVCVVVWLIRAVVDAARTASNPVVSYAATLSSLDYQRVPTATLANYYEMQPGVTMEERPPWGGESVFHRINNQGHNDPIDRMVFKPPGTYRIVAMGDSFTFGQYVPADKNYPSRLQSAMSRRMTCGLVPEIINLGVPGYDIQYSVERYSTHGKPYQPDLVIWLLKDDDFDDIQEFTLLQKGLIEYEASVSGKTAQYTQKFGIFFPEVMAVEKLRAAYSPAEILAFQRSYLDVFAKAYSGKLVIFTYRSIKKEYKEVLTAFAMSRPDTWIADVLTYKQNREWRFPDGHPTSSGYEQMAIDMMKYFASSGTIPCIR